jgi:hypothetical protein
MKRLSRYNEAIRLGAVIDSKAPSGGTAAGNIVILPVYETVQVPGLGASSASLTAFVNDTLSGQYTLAGVSVVFGTTSSSGTLQVEVATGTQAVAAGTNQLTGTVSLAGTANTTVNGTLVATASKTTITAGSRVNIILGGTLTGLANCIVSLVLERVA